jgi:hypothetical protein
MPTFIKTGFWEKLSKAPKEYLNLDNLIQSIGGGGGTSYKKYVALISQSGAADPTVIVLENTLGGDIVWTTESAGRYVGTLAGAFPLNKTVCFATTGSNYGNSNTIIGFCKYDDNIPDTVLLQTGWVYNGGGYPQNLGTVDGSGTHYEVSIEIRVYP